MFLLLYFSLRNRAKMWRKMKFCALGRARKRLETQKIRLIARAPAPHSHRIWECGATFSPSPHPKQLSPKNTYLIKKTPFPAPNTSFALFTIFFILFLLYQKCLQTHFKNFPQILSITFLHYQ